MYNKEIETLPLEKLRKLQNQRLQEMLQRQYTHVPFYKKALDERGIKPSDIKGVKDLHKLPFTKKTDLRDNYPFDLFAVPQDEVVRIHASSGTTGKPTVVGYNRHDLEVFDEVVARSLYCAGARKGMKLHNAYGYGLFTGGLGMHGGATRLGMAVIPVSGGMTDRQLMILQDFQPEVICCTPSYAQTLGEEIQKRGISLDSLNLKYAILGAEPWTEAIRQQVEASCIHLQTGFYLLPNGLCPG
ncbi:MAG: phenylacetate--CoA ligase, partial [Bacteroidota bacterium]